MRWKEKGSRATWRWKERSSGEMEGGWGGRGGGGGE